MPKTVKIDKESIQIDENYYVLFKMLESMLKEMKKWRTNG